MSQSAFTTAVQRHAAQSWKVVGGISNWAGGPARRRRESQGFGERAAKGCLWLVLFGWLFVIWRSLPYFAAGAALVVVVTWAVLVSMALGLALVIDGARTVVAR